MPARIPTPQEMEAARLYNAALKSALSAGRAALAAGRIEEAERHFKSMDDSTLKDELGWMYFDQSRWREFVEGNFDILNGGRPISEINGVRYEGSDAALAVAYYQLGDVANGDRYAPRKVKDWGARATVWDGPDGQEVDESPNQTPLDSPRKREAAAWFEVSIEATGEDDLRKLRCAEIAARMYPDVPTFAYKYAELLKSNHYFAESVAWYRRALANARGELATSLPEDIRITSQLVERGSPPDKGRRP